MFCKYEITLLKIWLPQWEWLWPEVAEVAQGVDEGHVGAAHLKQVVMGDKIDKIWAKG